MKAKRNWTYITATVIVYGFLLGAAVGSFGNIVGLAEHIGVSGSHAWTSPLLVDGIALMGKLLRSHRLAPAANRAGLRLMVFGGVLSLTANILHGHTLGDRIYGALLVVGFLIVERAAEHLAPAPAPVVEPKAGKRCEPGCTCGKHAGRKTTGTRRGNGRRRTPQAPAAVSVEAMLATTGPAPKSPAPYGA